MKVYHLPRNNHHKIEVFEGKLRKEEVENFCYYTRDERWGERREKDSLVLCKAPSEVAWLQTSLHATANMQGFNVLFHTSSAG